MHVVLALFRTFGAVGMARCRIVEVVRGCCLYVQLPASSILSQLLDSLGPVLLQCYIS
jgi:hypothetical protein